MNWWQDFFDADYAAFLEQQHDKRSLAEMAAFITRELELAPKNLVMDQCCGFGSLSFALAAHGMKVLGIDLCAQYIEKAKERQRQTGAACEFMVADAYMFKANPPCDAVVNCRTSFGYSADDETNKNMLQRAYDSLRPGGRFLLDATNAALVTAQFAPEHVYEMTTPVGRCTVTRRSAIDTARNMFTSHWEYAYENGVRKITYGESRIYFPEDLEKMLKACGFHSIRFLGNIYADAYHATSPRCIVLARRA